MELILGKQHEDFLHSVSSLSCILMFQKVALPKFREVLFKGTLSGLRQLVTTESPLKMMKNAFYFTLKALLVFKIFKFLS